MYSEEELIEELRKVSEEVEDSPSSYQFDELSDVSHVTLVDRFGGWNEALKKAGLPIRKDVRGTVYQGYKYDEEDIDNLRDEIKEYVEGCEDPFECTMSDFIENSQFTGSKSVIYSHLGQWEELFEKIKGKSLKQSRAEYRMSEIKKFVEDREDTPTLREVEEVLGKSIWYPIEFYGSWSEVMKRLGYEANKIVTDPESQWYGVYGEQHPTWKGGSEEYEDFYYGPSWKPELKEEIRSRDGNECRVCSLSNKEHIEHYQYPLNVHHIKPARDFEDTIEQDHIVNRTDNLITLCRTCHDEVERMFVDCKPDEFERRAKEYMDIEETSVKDSVFDY